MRQDVGRGGDPSLVGRLPGAAAGRNLDQRPEDNTAKPLPPVVLPADMGAALQDTFNQMSAMMAASQKHS